MNVLLGLSTLLFFVVLLALSTEQLRTLFGELLFAQRLVLAAEAADLPADGVQLAVGSLDYLLDLTDALLDDRHFHRLAGLAPGNAGRRVHHPLPHALKVAPSRRYHLRRLVDMRAQALVQPGELAD